MTGQRSLGGIPFQREQYAIKYLNWTWIINKFNLWLNLTKNQHGYQAKKTANWWVFSVILLVVPLEGLVTVNNPRLLLFQSLAWLAYSLLLLINLGQLGSKATHYLIKKIWSKFVQVNSYVVREFNVNMATGSVQITASQVSPFSSLLFIIVKEEKIHNKKITSPLHGYLMLFQSASFHNTLLYCLTSNEVFSFLDTHQRHVSNNPYWWEVQWWVNWEAYFTPKMHLVVSLHYLPPGDVHLKTADIAAWYMKEQCVSSPAVWKAWLHPLYIMVLW